MPRLLLAFVFTIASLANAQTLPSTMSSSQEGVTTQDDKSPMSMMGGHKMMHSMHAGICFYEGRTYSAGAVIKVSGTNLMLNCSIATSHDEIEKHDSSSHISSASWTPYISKKKKENRIIYYM